MSVLDGIEGIIGIRDLAGERLAAASYARRPDSQDVSFYCLPSERDREAFFCFVYFLRTSCQMFFESNAWPARATHHHPSYEH